MIFMTLFEIDSVAVEMDTFFIILVHTNNLKQNKNIRYNIIYKLL